MAEQNTHHEIFGRDLGLLQAVKYNGYTATMPAQQRSAMGPDASLLATSCSSQTIKFAQKKKIKENV